MTLQSAELRSPNPQFFSDLKITISRADKYGAEKINSYDPRKMSIIEGITGLENLLDASENISPGSENYTHPVTLIENFWLATRKRYQEIEQQRNDALQVVNWDWTDQELPPANIDEKKKRIQLNDLTQDLYRKFLEIEGFQLGLNSINLTINPEGNLSIHNTQDTINNNYISLLVVSLPTLEEFKEIQSKLSALKTPVSINLFQELTATDLSSYSEYKSNLFLNMIALSQNITTNI